MEKIWKTIQPRLKKKAPNNTDFTTVEVVLVE